MQDFYVGQKIRVPSRKTLEQRGWVEDSVGDFVFGCEFIRSEIIGKICVAGSSTKSNDILVNYKNTVFLIPYVAFLDNVRDCFKLNSCGPKIIIFKDGGLRIHGAVNLHHEETMLLLERLASALSLDLEPY